MNKEQRMIEKLNSFPKNCRLDEEAKSNIEAAINKGAANKSTNRRNTAFKGFVSKAMVPGGALIAVVLFAFLIIPFNNNGSNVSKPENRPTEQPTPNLEGNILPDPQFQSFETFIKIYTHEFNNVAEQKSFDKRIIDPLTHGFYIYLKHFQALGEVPEKVSEQVSEAISLARKEEETPSVVKIEELFSVHKEKANSIYRELFGEYSEEDIPEHNPNDNNDNTGVPIEDFVTDKPVWNTIDEFVEENLIKLNSEAPDYVASQQTYEEFIAQTVYVQSKYFMTITKSEEKKKQLQDLREISKKVMENKRENIEGHKKYINKLKQELKDLK
ncbi:hypothetical protein ACFO3D_15485 [Virgibacillus kekensis]|uniref:Anti-sigma factor n=1 Tax=Virgibacillus kekensis TaxID=202261 RepID=A0ABV9DL68_9BACI